MFWQKKSVGQQIMGQFNKEAKSIRRAMFIEGTAAAVDKLCADFPVLLANADSGKTRENLVNGMVDVIVALGDVSGYRHENAIEGKTANIRKLSDKLLETAEPGEIPKSFSQRLNVAALEAKEAADGETPERFKIITSLATTMIDIAAKANGGETPAAKPAQTSAAPAR